MAYFWKTFFSSLVFGMLSTESVESQFQALRGGLARVVEPTLLQVSHPIPTIALLLMIWQFLLYLCFVSERRGSVEEPFCTKMRVRSNSQLFEEKRHVRVSYFDVSICNETSGLQARMVSVAVLNLLCRLRSSSPLSMWLQNFDENELEWLIGGLPIIDALDWWASWPLLLVL